MGKALDGVGNGGGQFGKYAFVDEYGDANLELSHEGVSHYFIVTAIVVDGAVLGDVRASAEAIRAKHFQTGEMKSASVAGNDTRRLRVLCDVATLPITFVSLAVDKEAINRDGGLIYKTPFLRFLQGQVYRRLYQSISSLRVISDERGGKVFMDGFVDYVGRRHIRNLFNPQSFAFAPSNSEPLLQVADMVSGTLARHFDSTKRSTRSEEFLEALNPIAAEIATWPFSSVKQRRAMESGADDAAVSEVALEQAMRFLAENSESNDLEVQGQCFSVEYLLHHLHFVDSAGYVATKKLQDVLADNHGLHYTEHQLRASIVGPLRDAGLLIASSPKGYKIPISVAEILEFVDHAANIAEPLLRRVGAARSGVLLATAGATDILASDRYEKLRKLLEAAQSAV